MEPINGINSTVRHWGSTKKEQEAQGPYELRALLWELLNEMRPVRTRGACSLRADKQDR